MAKKSSSRSKSPRRVSRKAKSVKSLPEHEFEFGGPVGAFATMVALPLVIYFLYFAASSTYKCNLVNIADIREVLMDSFKLDTFFNVNAVLYVLGWLVLCVSMERFLFSEIVEGTKLKNGSTLKYRINGHLQFWVTLLIFTHGYPRFGEDGKFIGLSSFKLSWIYDNYLPMATSAILISIALSIYLYWRSHRKGVLLADGGNTGNRIYDFFIGRELNPRISDFDLKEFCELRPGLIGWLLINLGCAAKQFESDGAVSPSMVLINVFQGLYVWDALYHERAILTTMDITTDGFGYMLAFGDLAWVPFTYSLQARYLVENDPQLSIPVLCVICLLNFTGYAIFRGANSEKDAFRRNPQAPEVAHLETLTTKSGRKLLVSGWWGVARKINYTGDWLMGLAWCLTTGFDCIVTYFYAIYFCILLIHRSLRDNEACEKKYGNDWPAYQAKVPYAFIPGVY